MHGPPKPSPLCHSDNSDCFRLRPKALMPNLTRKDAKHGAVDQRRFEPCRSLVKEVGTKNPINNLVRCRSIQAAACVLNGGLRTDAYLTLSLAQTFTPQPKLGCCSGTSLKLLYWGNRINQSTYQYIPIMAT